jgi:transposase
MIRGFSISKSEWECTPQPVRAAALALQHQLWLLQHRYAAAQKQIASLQEKAAEVEGLQMENAALRERLGQNSLNSSRPPSSDAPQHRHHPKRQPSKRKRGAQLGHPGRGRRLKPSEEVDRIVNLRPNTCLRCGCKLKGRDPAPARHQVTEIPPSRAEVTEYRRHTLQCRRCGRVNQAEWDEEMPRGSFGPRVQAMVAYLTGRLGLSHRDVVEALRALHGVEMSLGSVAALQRQVSHALASPVETAQDYVQRQAVKYVDETGWPERCEQYWLWTGATEAVTSFRVLARRDSAAAREVIGKNGKGVVTTDRYFAYRWLSQERRQLCWAHLMRDFQAMAEREGESCRIGAGLLAQARKMFRHWHLFKDGMQSRRRFQAAMIPVQKRVERLLEEGSRCRHLKTRWTCRDILRVGGALWTFVRVKGVEPTNNQAERALRRAVLWRKKSFGTQSEAGSRFVERILTAVTTLRQQGRDVLAYLTAVCAAVRHSSGASVCLLPEPP